MKSKIIQALKATVHQSKANDIHIRCHEAGDVMYVSIGKPMPADDSELSADDILYRCANGEMTGFAITHFSER